jgi:hypothetical protein
MAENQIPAAQRHAADTILEAAPNLSLLEFFDKAAYLYYCMDGEILDPSVYFDLTNDRDSFTVGRDTVENLLERKENEKFHNSYQWELMFYDLIRQGDPERLMAFLMQDKFSPGGPRHKWLIPRCGRLKTFSSVASLKSV